MGRRIEVELTSARDDGSWTWRAAGARQPKGELLGTLLYDGAQVGDIVKVEAEFHIDGIEVTEVFAPKQKKERTNLLELKSRPLRDDELVTTQRVSRDERRGGGGGGGGRRRGRDREGGGRGRQDGRSGGPRRDRTPPPDTAEQRPKPKRLRAKRVHRDALLAEVGDEHRPIVEQVIRDGMPGVRAAIERQNAEAKEAGKPEIEAGPILAIAEKNLTKARLAEWRDRADAALVAAEDLDLRDLRSVVVAGNDLARDEESREIAEKLKTALDERVEHDHNNWLTDLETAITDGRVVRALRLSSRPVKAGAPLPPELATQLAGQASEALAADVGQERWATVLDALAFSPVRAAVTPAGLPSEPKKDLLEAVQRLADRIPSIAALFGVDPAKTPRSRNRRRGGRKDGEKGKGPKPQGSQRRGSDKSSNEGAPDAKADKPEPTPEAAPETKGDKPEPTPEAESDKAEATPEAGPDAKNDKPDTTPEPGPDAKNDKPEATPEAAPDAKNDKPEATPEAAPDAKSEQPEPGPEAEGDKPEPTPEPGPEAKSEQPEATLEPGPDAKGDTPEATPEPAPDATSDTPEAAPEAESEQPEPTPEPTPEAKGDTPEATPEPAPDATSNTPQATPKAESEQRPEPTPEAKGDMPEATPEPAPDATSDTPEVGPEAESEQPEAAPEPEAADPSPEPPPAPEAESSEAADVALNTEGQPDSAPEPEGTAEPAEAAADT